jgi:hypothetical protein
MSHGNEIFILTITLVGQSMAAFAVERMETVVVRSPPPPPPYFFFGSTL